MAKDPAVLFYINDWLTSTAEMDADVRGWYLNLLLHNYDKIDLPNDVEKLAVLCNVKFSEFERFKQVFEQVLKQKFELNENNRLTNLRTNDILKNREVFKEKRSNAGKVSYVMKFFAKNYNKEYKIKGLNEFVKNNFDYNIDLKNEHMIKQMFKHLFELYTNENENENEIIIKNKKEQIPNFQEFLIYAKEQKPLIDEFSVKAKYDSWFENGWKDGNNQKIKNWKTKLKNTLPFLKEIKKENEPVVIGRQTMATVIQNLDTSGVYNPWLENQNP